MKKIFVVLFSCFLLQLNCFAQTGITFLYINGSNNNDKKMERWYETGVKKLHPYMKNAFEKNDFTQKYFLKDGKYVINKDPAIFFWGFKSHNDLSFVEKNLSISKSFSTWCAYQIRYLLTCYLHDAIWVQKYHNMVIVLQDLHEMVKAEAKKGNKVVLYGYSAGSFITYEYLQTRLPYIKTIDFFNKVSLTDDEKNFVSKYPSKDTCMAALGDSKLAIFSATGHIIVNPNPELFKKAYLQLDQSTADVCIPDKAVKGIVNFASPLVLFFSDISDPNFELTYYNQLFVKYIIENDMFWLTVNYRADPLGFPGGRNLTIEELEYAAKIDIEPHAGFIYDQSDTWGRNSALATHTSYWATRRIFSQAVVRAYTNGYKHQYDDNFKQKQVNKFEKKFNIMP